MIELIRDELQTHIDTVNKMSEMEFLIAEAGELFVSTLQRGNKILLFGNGGSAGDAQHIAAELTGRYKKERRGLPGIALTTDTSALTAIGNDYGYDRVFDRQVEALAQEGDLLVGISTSGNSGNVISAIQVGKTLGCKTIGMSGKGGGKMAGLCDVDLIVPSDNTPRIQEMHIFIGHTLCQLVDDAY